MVLSEERELLRELYTLLEAERVKSARLRRRLEDMLYNLDEENMPTVAARLRALTADTLAFRKGASATRMTGEGLHLSRRDDEGEVTLTLTPDGIRAPAVFAAAGERTADMRALYVKEDGTVVAVLS